MKKNLKAIVSIILVLGLLVCLTGCGENEKKQEAIDEFNKTSRDLERTFKEADPRPDLKKARDDVKGALEDASKAAEKTLKDQPQQEE